MPRPLRLPVWALVSATRIEPIAGTEDSGYSYGETPAAKHWNWMRGVAGDWFVHLDKTTIRSSDELTSTGISPNRVSPTAVTFTLAGPLAQRPFVGGIYYCARERIDMSVVIAPQCPLYIFVANSTNYLWVRPRLNSSRSSYPETFVNQTGLPPNGEMGWYLIYRNTTNAATILTQQEESSVRVGFLRGQSNLPHTFKGPVTINPDPGLDAFALVVQTRQVTSGFASVQISSEVGQTNPLMSMGAQPGQSSLMLGASGQPAVPALSISLQDGSTGAHFTSIDGDADGAAIVSEMGTGGWNAVAFQCGNTSVPHQPAGPWATYWRQFISFNQTVAAGVRWRTGNGGQEWIPWASPGGQVLVNLVNADSGNIAGGGAAVLINLTNQTFIQFHKYVIRIECEANASAISINTIALTVAVNGVAQAPWNARQMRVAVDALNHPLVHTTVVYNHVAADTSFGTVTFSVAVGAGLGQVNFLSPRIVMQGAIR